MSHGKRQLRSVTESVTENMIYTASWKGVTESDTCGASMKNFIYIYTNRRILNFTLLLHCTR